MQAIADRQRGERVSIDGREGEVPVATPANTREWNLLGLPAMTVPCGFTADGLPVGMQLVARWWEEAMLVRVGAAYQAHSNWHTRRPPL